MKIDDSVLENLSKLSRLRFSEEEKAQIKEYLQQTLSHFEKIREIDTQRLKPLISPAPASHLTRADELKEFPPEDKKLLWDQIPKKAGAFVKAPPVKEESK